MIASAVALSVQNSMRCSMLKTLWTRVEDRRRRQQVVLDHVESLAQKVEHLCLGATRTVHHAVDPVPVALGQDALHNRSVVLVGDKTIFPAGMLLPLSVCTLSSNWRPPQYTKSLDMDGSNDSGNSEASAFAKMSWQADVSPLLLMPLL